MNYYKNIAKLFVDAEIRSDGRLSRSSMIHLENWISGRDCKMQFFTPKQLRELKHSALFIACYTAMVAELTP